MLTRRSPRLRLVAVWTLMLVLGIPAAAADRAAQKPAAAWVADLASPTQGTRTRATVALSKLRPMPPEAVSGVAALVGHESWSVRAQALMVLGNMGGDASSALPVIHGALQDPNEHVRRSAAGALARIPAQTRLMRLALVDALAGDDRYLRGRARAALTVGGEGAADIAPDLGRLLLHEKPEVRDAAVAVLAELPASAAVPVLAAHLTHEESSVRNGAARALGSFGAAAEPAVPTLVGMLEDGRFPYTAVPALARVGPGAEAAVPALTAMLEPTTNRELRIEATRALGAIGPAARVALPRFRTELAAQDLSEATGRYRAALAGAILVVGGPEDPALAAYVERLARAQSSWNTWARVEAMRALAGLGPVAGPAVPALRRSLRRDPQPKIRGLAADALGAIGAEALPALPDLRNAQSGDEKRVQQKAKAAIAKIQASSASPHADAPQPLPAKPAPAFASEPSIADDIAALGSSGSRQTRAALRLLRRGAASLPALHRAVRSPDTDARKRAEIIALLGDLGDPSSVDVLLEVEAAHAGEPGIRRDVVRALGELPPTPAGIALLTRVLGDPSEPTRIRRQALVALAIQRDPRGRTWAIKYRDDPDIELRAAALFLAASLGDRTAAEPITLLLREQPSASYRYGLLLGLAELLDPGEFETHAAPAQRFESDYASAHRIARFRSGGADTRAALFREMLASSYPNERRLAVRDRLAREQLAELTSLLADWEHVAPPVRATLAGEIHRAGYRITERDRQLVIERRESG